MKQNKKVKIKTCQKTVTGKHIWEEYSKRMFEITKRSMGGNPKYRCMACGLFDDRQWEAYAYGNWIDRLVNKFKS